MPLPEMHGRTHVPAGYSVVVKQDDPTIDPTSSDQLPCTTSTSSGTPIEFIHMRSTTSYGSGVTKLDVVETHGDYDLVTPTFAINGDDNLEIDKAGAYTIDCFLDTNPQDGSGTTWCHVYIETVRTGGPLPTGWHSWATNHHHRWQVLYYIPGEPLVGTTNHFHDFLFWDSDSFVGTPFELELYANRLIDGIDTANTNDGINFVVTRLGDSFS